MLGKRLFSPSWASILIDVQVLAHQRLLAFNVRPLSGECHISIYAPVCYRVVSRCRLITLFYIILYSNFLKRLHFLKNFFNFFSSGLNHLLYYIIFYTLKNILLFWKIFFYFFFVCFVFSLYFYYTRLYKKVYKNRSTNLYDPMSKSLKSRKW